MRRSERAEGEGDGGREVERRGRTQLVNEEGKNIFFLKEINSVS